MNRPENRNDGHDFFFWCGARYWSVIRKNLLWIPDFTHKPQVLQGITGLNKLLRQKILVCV